MGTQTDAVFTLEIAQTAPRFGDLAANVAELRALRQRSDADLLLTPELSLTGYDLRDRAPEVAQSADQLARLLAGQRAHAVGYVERGAEGIVYNSAAVLSDRLIHNHRKLYLPTYGMFDEGRYFGRGQDVLAFALDGWRFGLLICEDFWHPALAYLLACQRIDVLMVMAAAPGRGVWQGGEFGPFASSDVWERIARVTAQLHGIYVALCNRTGVEGGVTFAGDSLIAGPDGELLARAGAHTERLEATFHRTEIERARTPYAHLRDEQPRLVLANLERLIDG